MSDNTSKSSKHLAIEKSNATMFIILGIAAAVVSFSIVSTMYFIRRLNYQSKVINARVSSEKQLKKNYSELQKLVTSYKNFDSATESVIGTKDKNSKVVLDALPSKYDFPALTTSIEKIFKITGGLSSINITGTDQEATAQQSSISPKPIEIPITITGNGSYDNIQKLITNLQLSIRPFKVVNTTLSGSQSNMTFNISMITYYMPEKNLEIELKEVQ